MLKLLLLKYHLSQDLSGRPILGLFMAFLGRCRWLIGSIQLPKPLPEITDIPANSDKFAFDPIPFY
jgi:hypothetical protein